MFAGASPVGSAALGPVWAPSNIDLRGFIAELQEAATHDAAALSCPYLWGRNPLPPLCCDH